MNVSNSRYPKLKTWEGFVRLGEALTQPIVRLGTYRTYQLSRVADPHSFFTDPDQAF